MARSNRQILTGGKKYTTNKAKKHSVEEVTFDKNSRDEYLTGFHKRKLERRKNAEIFQKEQLRLSKIEERKESKLEKEKELSKQMERYKKSLKDLKGDLSDDEQSDVDQSDDQSDDNDEDVEVKVDGSDTEEWNGFNDSPKGILKKVYGEDETEVFIESIDSIAKLNYVDLDKSKKILDESIDRAQKYFKLASKPNKPKKKKFRYLTKGARRENNRKAVSNKRR